MTADHPQGDAPEKRVASSQGELLKGDLAPKVVPGLVTLWTERVTFMHLSSTLGQTLGGGIGSIIEVEMQEREERRDGPLLSLPLSDVRKASRGEFRLSHDVLVLGLADGRSVSFSHSFKHLAEPLRRLLTENYGRTIVQDGPDSWHVA